MLESFAMLLEGENNSIEKRTVAFSGGKMELAVGQEFTMFHEDRWVIESFTPDDSYSPSGFGGTPVVLCRYVGVGPIPSEYADEVKEGLLEFCADSVALAISLEEVRAKRDD